MPIQSAGKLENSFHMLLTNQLLWFDHSTIPIQSAGKLENSFYFLLTNQLLWFDHTTTFILSAGKLENGVHFLLTNQLLLSDHSTTFILSAGKLENGVHFLLTNQLLWFNHSTTFIQSAGKLKNSFHLLQTNKLLWLISHPIGWARAEPVWCSSFHLLTLCLSISWLLVPALVITAEFLSLFQFCPFIRIDVRYFKMEKRLDRAGVSLPFQITHLNFYVVTWFNPAWQTLIWTMD